VSEPELFHPCLRVWGRRVFALQVFLLTVLISLVPASAQTCATAGTDGNGGILTGIVNTYYPGTASVIAGGKTITLGTSRGATKAISSGDLLLVIQMQDAGINSSNNSRYGDGVNGGAGVGYSAANNTGKYEFVKATSAVPTSGGTVNILGTGTGGGLLNAYTNANYVAGTMGQRRFQVVRVPQYDNAALSSGLTAAAWDGTTGGVLALDVKGNLQLGGTVSVDGLGFRGGAGLQLQGAGGAADDYRNTAPTSSTTKTGFHGAKGEGIAGTPRYVWNSATSAVVDTGVEGYPNGSMGRGAPGNAGGGGTDSDPTTANPGGNDENSGGGGGGNWGAGGTGGNCWQSQNVTGGGGGVRFAEAIAGRVVMGGGGGAGTRNNDDNVTGASSGAAGGGIVIIRARKIIGTGTITANGAAAFNDTLNDGAGGGGAGGSIVIFALSSTLTGLTVSANGGRGGDAWRTQAAGGTPGERHGPGGGGGGGIIFLSSTATRTVTGGANGITTTSSDAFNATAGAAGTSAINLTSGQIPGISSGAECAGPTAIDLMNFAAIADPRGNVLLEWKTGYEVGNLGFNLYRDAGGKRTRLNTSLIGGTALLAGARTPFTAGFSYAWMDALASPKDVPAYWLEDLDTSGKIVLHGPISPRAVSNLPAQAQSLMLSQLRSNAPGATIEKISVVSSTTRGKATRLSSQSLQTQWDVAAKPGAKLIVNKAGWYRVTQPELVAAGFDVTKDPRYLQLFVDGVELPLVINGGLNGRLEPSDSIEFYATSADTAYTSSRAYYLLNGAQAGRRVVVLPPGSGDESRRRNFITTVERRDRFLYFSSLNNGEAENWYGGIVSSTPTGLSLTLSKLDQDADDDATLEVALQGLGATAPPVSHVVRVQVNGQDVGSLVFEGQQYQVNQFAVSHRFLQEGVNTVTLTAQGGSDFSVVGGLKLSYAHRFEADQNRLLFTASQGEAVQVAGFTTAAVRVFDVTDEANPSELRSQIEANGKSYRVTVVPQDAGERVLLALGDKAYTTVSQITPQTPSSWHLPTQGADVVLMTHASLRGAFDPLVQLRKSQGYAVALVDIEDVYDEYSYGQKTPQAVQDFLAQAMSWKKKPRYVLLAGDASYDPKNYLGLGDNDLVPTKLVWTNTFETASDDWLADLNGDGVADLAIGRLPVRTAAQAQAVVSKIVGYEQGAQTEGAVMVADLVGEYDFEAASQAVEQTLPSGMGVQEIFRSRMDDATAGQAIIDAVNRGPKLVNYAGHGSANVWRGNLLTNDSVAQMTNQQALPVVISMTCLNGLFNDARNNSLGETLLLSERGGAIAVWASSAQTVAGAQELVDQEMVSQLFNGTDSQGKPLTIGDAVMRAKAVARNEAVIQSWILLGDPLVRLR
jgi:Peptidase family C25